MANSPQFANRSAMDTIAISTANTNRDGTGTLGTLITAGEGGTPLSSIKAKATGTTTAGMVRIFLHDGSAFFLYAELTVDAITPSATVATWEETLTLPANFVLPRAWSIRCSTHNAETFHVSAIAGDI